MAMVDHSSSAQEERDTFEAQDIRSQTGIGAEGTSAH